MNSNPTHRPHTADISVQLEVHSLLDTGECSGKVVHPDVLKDYGITPAFKTTVSGHTLDDCLKKLYNKLEELKNATNSKE